MELKGLRIYDKNYGEDMVSNNDSILNPVLRKKTLVGQDIEFNFNDPELDRILCDEAPQNSVNPCKFETNKGEVYNLVSDKDRAYEFLQLIACCHEVSGTKAKDSEYFSYSGQSPDEVCLVDAAQRIGATFVDNRNNIITLNLGMQGKLQREVKMELLYLFPFDSSRARMSVIIRDDKDNVKLYCKGSDERLISLLKKTKSEQKDDKILVDTEGYLLSASLKGLRTLYMGMRVIDKNEFANWKARMDEVKLFVPSNDEEVIEKRNKYNVLVEEIEKDLTYLGCTVVEDKLQENVENTIHNLAKAGVQVWMITGDKMGTAKTIGYSCRMFIKQKMEVIQIDEEYYRPGSIEVDENKILNKLRSIFSNSDTPKTPKPQNPKTPN